MSNPTISNQAVSNQAAQDRQRSIPAAPVLAAPTSTDFARPVERHNVPQTGSLMDRMSNRSRDQVAEMTASSGDMPAESLRESVIRNLTWLLNTTRLESTRDLSDYPNVRRSVLNFGIPEITGKMLASASSQVLERELAEAINRFEPRLRDASVTIVAKNENYDDYRSIVLVIEGQCEEDGQTYDLHLAADVDSESGRVVHIH